MKKLIIIGLVVMTMVVFASCATMADSGLLGPGNFYSDTATVGAVRGESTSKVWLGVFGEENYPTVERVAKENGISKIATVEHYKRMGILGLWTDFTTIVTGE